MAEDHVDAIPPRGTEAYVQWVVQEAIRTGMEEGSPLRDPAALADSLRRDEHVAPYHTRAYQEVHHAAHEAAWNRMQEERPGVETEQPSHGVDDHIFIDTENPQMETGFQTLLAQLDQRLDAIGQAPAPVEQGMDERQRPHHEQGMSY